MDDEEGNEEFTPFRRFTRDSLFNVKRRIAEEKAIKAAEDAAADSDDDDEPVHQDDQLKPNTKLEAGKKLPPTLEDFFESEHVGRPLEDIDEYYQNKETFCVIGRDKTVFRFSATNGFFILSPFNIFRRIALYILVHPLFSVLVILTIIVNCIFMTFTNTPGGDYTEYVFTAIYTVESLVKMTARGYVLQPFTYLRDPWNWLDFGVIAIAYMTMFIKQLGNLSALRTFRVLRALKTVAVVPGLKTIVGALLEAVIRLRDVGILTSFVLSIFALIGMQLYSGRLRNKCVMDIGNVSLTDEEWYNFTENSSNWDPIDSDTKTMCGNASSAGKCPDGFLCMEDIGDNPNFGFTSFDNFGWALLCAFRLMTQDYWENLYMLVLRAEGLPHSIYFDLVILLGSFYLINLILAIVAMSYDEQQKADKADEEEMALEKETKIENIAVELDELLAKSPSIVSNGSDPPFSPDKVGDSVDRISVQSEKHCGDPHHLRVASTKDDSECDFSKRSKGSCRTPSASQVDPKDVMVLRELIDHVEVASRRKSGFSGSIFSIENEPLKDKVKRLVCDWEVPPWFIRIQNAVGFIILDAFVDLFITLCILANTAFMAADHHGMSPEMGLTLEAGNKICSYIFAVEAFLKIVALGFIVYIHDRWNMFDFVIVMLSFLEMLLEGVKGLSVLRTFRLLRVFKLAKSWPTLNMLISIVARTLGALGNLTFVLGIVIFIFAVMGQQLFAQNYVEFYGDDIPRWNFKDFLHSFMIVFRVLCGEWIESMWNCVRAAGPPCIPFFLLTFVIGNLVVLNLFLALLISSFGTDTMDDDDDPGNPNKLAEALNRFSRFGNWVKVHVIVLVKRTKEGKRPLPVTIDANAKNGTLLDGNVIELNGDVDGVDAVDAVDTVDTVDVVDAMLSEPPTRTPSRGSEANVRSTMSDTDGSTMSDDAETQSLKKVELDGDPEINEVDVEFAEFPDDCFCNVFRRKCQCCTTVENTKCGLQWWDLRVKAFRVAQHKYFETFIIVMILASSLALAMEDIYLDDRPWLKLILEYMDGVFTVVFFLEMVIKMFAYGWKFYFTDAWCWLDFVIVAISLVMVGAKVFEVGDPQSLKAMRTLRALRPLRAVSRWEGMRVVVNALVKAIPSILNVLLVCIVFWLIFCIVGVQFFSGKFFKCVDFEGNRLNASIVANESECLQHPENYTWENSQINFDNVLNAYLALFQVATYKGWIDIIRDSVDSPMEKGQQPQDEQNRMFYIYFVLFIIFGSFFTLNLFIGVIIDNFNKQKKMAGSLEMFMTEDQKKYYNAMKRMQSKSPQKAIPRPTWFPADYLFDMTTSQKFDILIMVVIMLNMVTMTLEHYNQTLTFTNTLYWINFSFIVVFTAECIMKLLALRQYYFKIPWNVFDFAVVVLSVLGLALGGYLEEFLVSPTLLRVVRVFRVGRVLRLVKSAKGIRTLLFSLAVSLPALFNIGLLLFLVLFIYAVFGMNFFKDVKVPHGGLDDVFNFQTFFKSLITLFQMCTSAGWDGVLNGLMNEDDCERTPKNTCGHYALAVLYLITYLVISFLVVVNMYIAVILENFSQATEDVQQGLTPEDFDMYYEKWEKFDPDATQYISLEQLSEFVDYLEEPLQLQKPNYFLLVKLDIPIYEGDLCFCRDILDALTKNFLGTADTGDIPTEEADDKKKVEYEVTSSTLMRQKEHYAARIIQKAYRSFRSMHGGFSDPPPYNEVIIEIPTNNDTTMDVERTSKNELIEMQDIPSKGSEENDNKEEKDSNENIDRGEADHTIVEVDLKPDSDVVA